MSTRIAWPRLISALVLLLQDAIRFHLLGTHSSAALKAENLFLRKQLALYLERKAKPAEPMILLILVWRCFPGCSPGKTPWSSSGRKP
jgi:hypothetical protein